VLLTVNFQQDVLRSEVPMIRSFAVGDGPELAAAWTAAAPADPIGYSRFRDLFLLDRNFDPAGLKVAVRNGRVVGAAYGVRRLSTECGTGWIPFLFVHPEARGQGLGRELLTAALDWLRGYGCVEADFSSYTPNYFLPGLDRSRYPAAWRLLSSSGFEPRYGAVAMDRSLVGYSMPAEVRKRLDELAGEGYSFGTPTGDELTEVIGLAGAEFAADWARAIREAVVLGMPLERIVVARDRVGRILGWAQHATYEGMIERFGPFGVLPSCRGLGLGQVLLHLTLTRMAALGAHSAWFLWADKQSAAGRLYLGAGFTITRTFTILRANL
jgi:GNAT superfamily N-acetyltransferase